jgi:hypothetical protein
MHTDDAVQIMPSPEMMRFWSSWTAILLIKRTTDTLMQYVAKMKSRSAI